MKGKWYINRNGEQVDYGDNLYKIGVSYNLGGVNYFNGKRERRGYYVHFTPGVDRTHNGTYTTEKSTMFAGFKVCLREVKRASAKTEAEVCKIVEDALAKVAEVVKGEGGDEEKSDKVGSIFLALAS